MANVLSKIEQPDPGDPRTTIGANGRRLVEGIEERAEGGCKGGGSAKSDNPQVLKEYTKGARETRAVKFAEAGELSIIAMRRREVHRCITLHLVALLEIMLT